MTTLATFLVRPGPTADRLRHRPAWIGPAALLALVSVLLMILGRARAVEVTLSHLPAAATAEDRAALVEYFRQRLPIDAAFLPIRLLLGWVGTSLLVAFLLKMWTPGRAMSLRQVLSLTIHAEVAMVLARAAALLTSADGGLRIPLGLESVFVLKGDAVQAAALNALNAFSLWYVLLLALSLRSSAELPLAKAFVTSLLAWSLCASVNIGVLALLRERLHLLL